MAKGQAIAEERAWKREISGAWHGAAFARMKKMPKLDEVLKRIGRRKPAAPQTPEQMAAAAALIVAAFGGKDLRKKSKNLRKKSKKKSA